MAWKELRKRVDALETRAVGIAGAWHRIIQRADQSEDEAVAAYEAANGVIGSNEGTLLVVIRKPVPSPVCA